MDKPLVAITGASSGIGEATARAFSSAGHPVLMMARRLEKMKAMNLPDTVCRKVDVRHRDEIRVAVEDAERIYGPVDMMFANAGVARLADIGRQSPEEWDEMIDINTKGVMNTVHAVMRSMMERQSGTLVMMSSIAGRKVYPDHTVYCGDHMVHVLVVSPGVIETEILSGVLDEGTLEAYRRNKVRIGGGIGADIVGELILNAYQLPQNALVQEICLTPTRQRY